MVKRGVVRPKEPRESPRLRLEQLPNDVGASAGAMLIARTQSATNPTDPSTLSNVPGYGVGDETCLLLCATDDD